MNRHFLVLVMLAGAVAGVGVGFVLGYAGAYLSLGVLLGDADFGARLDTAFEARPLGGLAVIILISAATLAAVGGILGWKSAAKLLRDTVSRSASHANEEYQEVGGGAYRSDASARYATYPFVTLRIDPVSLQFRMKFAESFRFERRDLVEFRFVHGWLFSGVQIVHSVATYPKSVVFWPLDARRLERELRRIGYVVSVCSSGKQLPTIKEKRPEPGQS